MSVRNAVKAIQQTMWKDAGVDGDAQRLSQLCWMFFLKIVDDQDQQLQRVQSDYQSPIPVHLRWSTWASDPQGLTGSDLVKFINGKLFPALKALPAVGKWANRAFLVRSVLEDAHNYMKNGQLIRQVVNKISEFDFNDLVEREHFGDIYEQLLNDLQAAGNAGEFYTPRGITAFMVDRINPQPGEFIYDPSCGTGGFLTCSIRYMRERYVKTPRDELALQNGLRATELKQLPHMLCVTNMLLHGIADASFVKHADTLSLPYSEYTKDDEVDVIVTNPPFGAMVQDGIESNFPVQFRSKETADLFLALIIRLLKEDGRAAVVLPDSILFGEGVKTRIKEMLLQECNLHTIVRLPKSVFKPYASIGTNLLFFEKGTPTKHIWFYEHLVPDGQKAYSMTKPIRVENFHDCIEWWGGSARKGRKATKLAWKISADEIKARNYNLDFRNPHTVVDDFGQPEDLLDSYNEAESRAASLREKLKDILQGVLLG